MAHLQAEDTFTSQRFQGTLLLQKLLGRYLANTKQLLQLSNVKKSFCLRVGLNSIKYLLILASMGIVQAPCADNILPKSPLNLSRFDLKAYKLLDQRISAGQEYFYIYREADSSINHGFPSGIFGANRISTQPACLNDPASLSGCSSDPNHLDRGRGTVLQVFFDQLAPGEFAGLHLEEPEGFSKQGGGVGYDLSGATHLLFEARSPIGLTLRFGVGGCTTEFVHIPQSPDFKKFCITLNSQNDLSCPVNTDFKLGLNASPDLTDLHLLFTLVTNDINSPKGGVILLDNIRVDPVPHSQRKALGFPTSVQTFGVMPLPKPGRNFVLMAPDQVNSNLATTYDAALTLMAFLKRGPSRDFAKARRIAETFHYALQHDSSANQLPMAPDGSAGLHSGYESGDIALFNDDPASGAQKGDVRLASISWERSILQSGWILPIVGWSDRRKQRFCHFGLSSGIQSL